MPVMDGFEATRIIREREGDSGTPASSPSRQAMEGDRERWPRRRHGRLPAEAVPRPDLKRVSPLLAPGEPSQRTTPKTQVAS